MLEHCATRTGCPHFGLLVGQQAGLGAFGLVGLLVKYSPDVESALHSLSRFMHLHVRGAVVNLSTDSDLAVLEYQIYQPRARGNDQVGAGAVAVAYNILRELCGEDWKPAEVRFAHRRPLDISPFANFFQASLHFDAGQYAVAFSNTWLNRPSPGSSPELLRILQREINKLEIRQEASFLDQLRGLLRTTLSTGHSSADQVAELFSMNRRTLNRHLNAFGTNFREVADEIRFEIARQFLEDSAMDISQIALFLGYSNASAFTRAFRRWSSLTPSNWRLMAKDGERGSS
jgi:AraC-like DNA-binding protein